MTGVVLGVKSLGWLLARSPQPVLSSCAPTVAAAAVVVAVNPRHISGIKFRGYAGAPLPA